MKKLSLLGVLASCCLLVFTGCEGEEETNQYKAQQCLNNATQTTANSCLSFIANDFSQKAYIIRCSVAFLAEGIDDGKIVDAFENIKGEEGGDPSAPAIAALAMSNTTASSDALTICTTTGSEVLTTLANFANLATTMTQLLPGLGTPPYSNTDIENAINNYVPGSADVNNKDALGAAVVAAAPTMCNSEDGTFKDSPICTDINSAINAGGGNQAIADALISNLDD